MKDAPTRKLPAVSANGGGKPNFHNLAGPADDTHSANWRDYPADDIRGVISAVTGVGSGITFGCTSDGGALSVALLTSGEQPAKYYFTSVAQFEQWAQRLYQSV